MKTRQETIQKIMDALEGMTVEDAIELLQILIEVSIPKEARIPKVIVPPCDAENS